MSGLNLIGRADISLGWDVGRISVVPSLKIIEAAMRVLCPDKGKVISDSCYLISN